MACLIRLAWERVSCVPLELEGERLYSEELELQLVQEGEELTFYDPIRAERLLTPVEQARRTEEQARRADRETALRTDAEAEIARLRAELEALRAPPN
jgi:hypothetical protein